MMTDEKVKKKDYKHSGENSYMCRLILSAFNTVKYLRSIKNTRLELGENPILLKLGQNSIRY